MISRRIILALFGLGPAVALVKPEPEPKFATGGLLKRPCPVIFDEGRAAESLIPIESIGKGMDHGVLLSDFEDMPPMVFHLNTPPEHIQCRSIVVPMKHLTP